MFSGLKNKIKKISNHIKHAKNNEACQEFDKDGRLVIPVKLNNIDDAYSKFSPSDKPQLDEDFIKYLLNNNAGKFLLLLKMENETLHKNVDERQKFENALKTEFYSLSVKKRKQITKNTVTSLILFLIGSLVLTLSILFVSTFPLRSIEIAAWVFVWESVDRFFLRRPEMRREFFTYIKLFYCNFSYTNNSIKEE